MAKKSPYDTGLDRNRANYVPLSPLTFLERSAFVYPAKIAVIQGGRQYSWAETYARCRRLASVLVRLGIGKNDTVAVMLPNTAAMFEVHFGVPMAGAVLNTLEVEDLLYRHPAVLSAAVVAMPDGKWGEVPCAFLELRQGATVTKDEIIAYCRANLAHFKVPKHVMFRDIPKTSTGKIQKYLLRNTAKSAQAIE